MTKRDDDWRPIEEALSDPEIMAGWPILVWNGVVQTVVRWRGSMYWQLTEIGTEATDADLLWDPILFKKLGPDPK